MDRSLTDICCLLHTNDDMSLNHLSILIPPEKISRTIFKDYKDWITMRTPSWRCDCVHVVSRCRGSRWATVKQRRWPGKSGSFPSILQRQWDVRGRRPFPANQREERTPPSTSAQTVMRFPCLCWLMEVWRYLYPFWQRTGIQRRILYRKEELQSLIGQDCLSSSKVWVNFLTVSDVWVVKI